MKFLKNMLLTATLLASSAASAAFIEFTDLGDTTLLNNFGDKIEWLDLTKTAGYSLDQVNDDLDLDGNLDVILGSNSALAEGWEVASHDDVYYMIYSYFYDFNSGTEDYSPAKISSFINLFGDTFVSDPNSPQDYAYSTMGFTSTLYEDFNTSYVSDPNEPDAMAAIQVMGHSRNEINYDWPLWTNSVDVTVGTWLKRAYVEVSTPASFGLLLIAFAGLLIRRK